MQFIKHDLGEMIGGEIVEVSLTSAAYVRLMDSANFRFYRSGRPHKSHGGHYKTSPVKMKIPYPGHWIVAVDLAGYAGEVGSDFRILEDAAVNP